jgi:hypothetical protein
VTLGAVITKNLIPVILGNFIAGAFVVAGSYSYQFGKIGAKSRERYRQYLKQREASRLSREVAQIESKRDESIILEKATMFNGTAVPAF